VTFLSFIKNFDWTKVNYVFRGILVGIFVSIFVSLFRFAISYVFDITLSIYEFLSGNPIWIIGWVLLSLVMAFILAIFMRDEPNIGGSGIQDLEGQLHGTIKMNWFSVLWRKFIGSVISIGSGLALGREGPSIQIGGVVGQGVNHFLRGNRTQENVLVSAGAAAGLAAAFNTPVSGVLFVIDEVHKKISNVILITAFTASVTANFITYYLLNIDPTIDLEPLSIFPLRFYFLLIILGIFVAAFGAFYQEITFIVQDLYKKLPIPNYLNPFIPFLLVIPVGLYFPSMLGGGENLIEVVGESSLTTQLLIAMIVFRFIFMNLSYGSGLPGGIFLPLLSFGALLGGLFANGAMSLASIPEAYLYNFVVYAMGGLLTSVTKAPLMSVMLMVEMTGRVTHVMPLAVVCLVAYVTADFLRSEPIYEVLLAKKVGSKATNFQGEISEYELVVEPNSPLDGLGVKDLNMPGNSLIVRIERNGRQFIPSSDMHIAANDTLVSESDTAVIFAVQQYLDKLNTQDEEEP
jgi:H+/Cl- antiporter ClcA